MRRAALLVAVCLAVTLAPAAAARAQIVYVTPAQGQVLDPRSYVTGDCAIDEHKIQSEYTYWQVDGVIPAFRRGGNGVTLAPRAEDLPRPSQAPDGPPFAGTYVMEPRLLATPKRPSGCGVMSFDALRARGLEQAGPHVFVQYTQTVDFVRRGPDEDSRLATPCAQNDPEFQSPADVNPPPLPENSNDRWDVDTYCNTVKVIGFYVTARSQCTLTADMSQWPAVPYINQYEAGARLGLPKAGGNACGPSSLLMAMLGWSGPNDLPTLRDAYDQTMRHSLAASSQLTGNDFVGHPNAEAYAKSLGWLSAHVLPTGSTAEEIELHLVEALAKGPVVVSTAFGVDRWGATGGGHMIAVVGADARGSWIVDDPAGNFFSKPAVGYQPEPRKGHYGPGSCGHRAIYPHFWLMAYVTGRWLLTLGPRATPQQGGHVARASAAAARPRYGSAIALSDPNPESTNAPQSVYLQNGSGQRAGWVDGRAVAEIPNAAVDPQTPGWTDPGLAAADLVKLGDPPPAPRAIVLPGDGRGLTLHVKAAAGSRFTLRAQAWQDGAHGVARTVTGSGSGSDGVVALPALSVSAGAGRAGLAAGKATVRRRVVTVPLACAAAARTTCRFRAVLSTRQGGRTVVIAARSGTLRSGKKLKLRLEPGAAARRFLAKHRGVLATLAVTEVGSRGTSIVAARERLRI